MGWPIEQQRYCCRLYSRACTTQPRMRFEQLRLVDMAGGAMDRSWLMALVAMASFSALIAGIVRVSRSRGSSFSFAQFHFGYLHRPIVESTEIEARGFE